MTKSKKVEVCYFNFYPSTTYPKVKIDPEEDDESFWLLGNGRFAAIGNKVQAEAVIGEYAGVDAVIFLRIIDDDLNPYFENVHPIVRGFICQPSGRPGNSGCFPWDVRKIG